MNIKLVALDMDGTLLNSKKEKPAEFIPWVEKHPESSDCQWTTVLYFRKRLYGNQRQAYFHCRKWWSCI